MKNLVYNTTNNKNRTNFLGSLLKNREENGHEIL